MKPNHARFYWRQLEGARRVLDLGCATGDLGKFRPDGVQVFGIDLNPTLLSQAKQYELVQAWDLDQGTGLPFPDRFFDAVVAKDILEHLQKPWKTVAEMRRILRPRGLALASVITPRGRQVWSDYTHVRGFTVQALRQMFTDAGFTVSGVWRMGGIPLTARLDILGVVPYLLRLPPLDWLWTSSYEIKAQVAD